MDAETQPQFAQIPEGHLPSETTMSGGRAVDADAMAELARYVQHAEAGGAMHDVGAQHGWVDTRTVRGVLRTALLNRIERAGERELRQRSAQEIAFILLAFAVAALVAAPALVPVVVALRGGQL